MIQRRLRTRSTTFSRRLARERPSGPEPSDSKGPGVSARALSLV